jgi:thioesterase domain-containing protein
VYGLLARGISGMDAPYPTVEEAAAAYAEQIMARQPEGPLHLAGYSYGGLVAYEMARLLTERGRKVENVILFDTYPPNEKYRYKHYGLQYVLLSFLCLVTSPGNLRDFFRNQYWRSLQRRAKSVAKRVACRAGMYQYPAHPFWNAPEDDTALRDQIRLRLFRVLSKAVHRYRLNPYQGKVVFIRAMEGPARYLSHSDFGWKKNVSGPVAVHNVPGVDHHKIFAHDRHVRAVAEAMALHLASGENDRKRRRPARRSGRGVGYPEKSALDVGCSSVGKNMRLRYCAARAAWLPKNPVRQRAVSRRCGS